MEHEDVLYTKLFLIARPFIWYQTQQACLTLWAGHLLSEINVCVEVVKGQIWDGPISKNDPHAKFLQCTKFHAFIIKWTIHPFLATNLLYYTKEYL